MRSLVELAHDVEDALRNLGDERADDGAVSKVEHVQPSPRRRVQPVPGFSMYVSAMKQAEEWTTCSGLILRSEKDFD